MSDNTSNPFKNEEIVKEDDELKNEADGQTEEQIEENNEENQETATTEQNELQQKYDELNQQYIRLMADFDNYRKRQAQERDSLVKLGTETALTKLIEVLDNFERGQKALEGVDDCAKIKESFDLIQKQVYETLTKMGLEEIKAIGEEFDPNFHEAVMQTPTSDYPEHAVIAELRKGYKYGDKVLRPTMVNVASAQ